VFNFKLIQNINKDWNDGFVENRHKIEERGVSMHVTNNFDEDAFKKLTVKIS